MKTYVEVLIISSYGDVAEFIDALRQFDVRVEGWQYMEAKSKDYATATGEPSCTILQMKSSHCPAVAITRKCGSTFYVANIVPQENSQMSMQEYNQVASEFAKELRKYAKSAGLQMAVKATSGLIGLKEIISGKKCREMFEQYMNLNPTSYHPLDIERLDAFIYCLSRNTMKSKDLGLLRGWLIEENGWSPKDANLCVERIDVGLSILRVNRKYF